MLCFSNSSVLIFLKIIAHIWQNGELWAIWNRFQYESNISLPSSHKRGFEYSHLKFFISHVEENTLYFSVYYSWYQTYWYEIFSWFSSSGVCRTQKFVSQYWYFSLTTFFSYVYGSLLTSHWGQKGSLLSFCRNTMLCFVTSEFRIWLMFWEWYENWNVYTGLMHQDPLEMNIFENCLMSGKLKFFL